MGEWVVLSPLLKNALETLEHALDHYDLNTDRDRKFAILHADQAVELILKEAVRRKELSIFRKDKKTSIGIHAALSALGRRKVSIPESANLELLHDERNRIQHTNSTPDEDTTNFYIDMAVRFMRRFLVEELSLDLRRTVSASLYEKLDVF